MSTSNMIIIIGIILLILGIAATVSDLYYYIYFAKNRISLTLGHQLFTYTAIVMYFLTAIYSSCLLCINGSNSSNIFDSFNFFALVSVICAFFDGYMKFSLNPIVSLMFFVYFGLGALCLFVTCTAEQEIKKEKQRILKQFNTGQISSPTTSNCTDQPMLDYSGHDDLPKFSMNLQAVKIENDYLKP